MKETERAAKFTDNRYWSELEKRIFIETLRIFGREMEFISAMLPKKSADQVKNYWGNFAKRKDFVAMCPSMTRHFNHSTLYCMACTGMSLENIVGRKV